MMFSRIDNIYCLLMVNLKICFFGIFIFDVLLICVFVGLFRKEFLNVLLSEFRKFGVLYFSMSFRQGKVGWIVWFGFVLNFCLLFFGYLIVLFENRNQQILVLVFIVVFLFMGFLLGYICLVRVYDRQGKILIVLILKKLL